MRTPPVSAISYVHKLKGYADPTKAFLILKLLSATKSRSRSDIRLPITLPVLRLLVDALRHTSSSFYHRTLFTAMFLTAFYGFLRVGDLTCQTTSSGRSVLQHQDLSFLLRQGEVIAQAAQTLFVIYIRDSIALRFEPFKRMYENGSKIALNSTCSKGFK